MPDTMPMGLADAVYGPMAAASSLQTAPIGSAAAYAAQPVSAAASPAVQSAPTAGMHHSIDGKPTSTKSLALGNLKDDPSFYLVLTVGVGVLLGHYAATGRWL